MGRSPCCEKVGLKKGPWTPEEDQKLLAYVEEHGHGSWRALPAKAGLQRCGKSCRLRWTNYLRPDIKRGKFNLQEEQTIIQLHALLGNRWSAIATHLPKRTDNEIKNYWNTHLKKKLDKMGIDPVTHQPKNDTLLSGDGPSKAAANLSHMAQWERARLEAEARLVRQSKLRSPNANSLDFVAPASTSSDKAPPPLLLTSPSPCLDILKAWNRVRTTSGSGDLHSPKSTLSFSENVLSGSQESEEDFKRFGTLLHREDLESSNSMMLQSRVLFQEMTRISMEGNSNINSEHDINGDQDQALAAEKFTDLLLCNFGDHQTYSEGGGDSDNGGGCCSGSDYCEDNKDYWNNILNLVNSSPSHSPMF